MILKTFFSGGTIERAAHVRDNAAQLENAWADPATRFVVVCQSRCLVRDDAAVLLRRADLGAVAELATSIYLGQLEETHVFAVALPELAADDFGPESFSSFRGLMGDLPADDAALLAYAKGMVEWQQRHRYCSVCGSANQSTGGGFVMTCSSPECGRRDFPRTDPAIIVLVSDGEQCLLGRQNSWPAGRFSTIAGFVEPGESLEDAVRREVREETDVRVADVRYLGSQPWPFPGAIMIGFHATAAATAIRLNDGELAEARWLTREQLAARSVNLPPATSIAFRLIEQWFNEWDGPRLVDLQLSTDFSRSAGERN